MAFDYASIAAPLILGTASLIAFISLRTTSISDRIRTADEKIVTPGTTPARRANLLAQVRTLHHRYTSSTYALIALLTAFLAFVLMGVLHAASRAGTEAAFGVGVTAGALGFVLTLYEVASSGRTLYLDITFAEQFAASEEAHK